MHEDPHSTKPPCLQDSVNEAMAQTGMKRSMNQLLDETRLCGQKVTLKVSTEESSKAMGTLRQVLLRYAKKRY